MQALLEDDVEVVLLVDDRTPSEHPYFMSKHSTNADQHLLPQPRQIVS